MAVFHYAGRIGESRPMVRKETDPSPQRQYHLFVAWSSRRFVQIFYLPLALCVPPPIFFIHQQFNVLYQFWLHTETVRSLGPLEWVLSTPRHHRVHHGSTLKCLDKNYGGTLIIWDRLFGTFAEEPKEEIIYGLVMNQPSFNPLYLQ
ncbi:unnamed protein product, partial [Nesidiocoris tenuis]